jgi:hypothetical protein
MLHYTPNRWLVLVVTSIVAARVLYGFWRSWTVAQAGVYGTTMMLAFGIPQSLAAGGTVMATTPPMLSECVAASLRGETARCACCESTPRVLEGHCRRRSAQGFVGCDESGQPG